MKSQEKQASKQTPLQMSGAPSSSRERCQDRPQNELVTRKAFVKGREHRAGPSRAQKGTEDHSLAFPQQLGSSELFLAEFRVGQFEQSEGDLQSRAKHVLIWP